MFARFYDAMMEDVDYGRLYETISPFLSKEDIILDAGCGSGRLLVEFLRHGYQAFGIDSDTEMLSLAYERLNGLGQQIRLFDHDLRKPLDVQVDVIVLMFDVLNYMKGIKGVLHRLDQALVSGGRLIFDVYREEVLQTHDGYVETGDDPTNYTWRIAVRNQTMVHTVKINAETTIIRQTIRPLGHDLSLLREMGYHVTEILGPDSRKHYIVAVKP